MKLNRLRLKNFGIFYGDYDFNLAPKNSNQKVILFGGKNGSGKTTILEALRLALYGPLAYGFKVDSPAYIEKIQAKLNSFAVKAKETKYQIMLDIELVENYEKQYYTIRRYWEKYKNGYRESLEVHCNGKTISGQALDIFQTKIREETPPHLLELFLFDGEKISQIVTENSLAAYLKESSRVLFNLDLFESLESDLTNYLKSEDRYNNLSKEEQHYFTAKEDFSEKKNQRVELLTQLDILHKSLQDKEASLSELEKLFDTHGGLQKQQRDSLLFKMKEIDNKRNIMMDKTREIITTIFPFMLVHDNLKSISLTMQNEAHLLAAREAQSILNAPFFQSLLEPLIKKGLLQSEVSSSGIAEMMHEAFSNTSTIVDESSFIHYASYEQRAQIESILQRLKSFNPDEIAQNYSSNTKLLKEIKTLKRQIDANDSTNELKDMLKGIHNLSLEIDRMSLEKEHLESSLVILEEELSLKEKELELLSNKFMQSKKSKSIVNISDQVISISKSFRDLQTRKKLQQVEIESAKMLNSLFRKEMFVVKLWIHPETFEIRLFDSNGEEISKDTLSAGEKQLLLLSIIWAMSTCSNRRLPFVFDTLLGRLDQSHKKSLIEQFIPRCGEQVVILSTDSEIDKKHFKFIHNSVSQTYTIEYNKDKNDVLISENYFGQTLKEVNPVELSTQNV
ncbi:DNA sulfur modification protein DndD [Paenibacillus sp. DP01]|uniref:DNA sulfur modification protein DndD n=1 Tax=Paenibacillus sp. DP01 TaxID=3373096 RepID=UPI00384D0A7F